MKQRKVTRHSRDASLINVEDVFLDKLAKSDKEKEELSERKLEVPLKRANFFCLLLVGLFVFGILAAVTFHFQVYGKEKYEELAEQNKFLNLHLTSERGVIYDRAGRQLVYNEASFDLWLFKEQLPAEAERILKNVDSIIGKTVDELAEQINATQDQAVLVKKNLDHKTLILLETRKEDLPGFKVRKRILRHYETAESLGHILGYLGKMTAEEFETFSAYGYEFGDFVGKEGVERVYEGVLKEQKGQIQIERTAQGKVLSQRVVDYPKSGNSLVLSLDLELQKKVEEFLSQTLKEVGATKGAVVMLNPNNGEVLASISLPGFDNNLFSAGISLEDFQKINEDSNNPQLNRVISGYYLTGSTIKPFIALAALEEGLITENTSLYCPMSLCIPHQYTQEGQCFDDWVFHGWTDVKRAIAESVNPFFYIIGGGYTAPSPQSEFFDSRLPRDFEGLGVERIDKYLNLFGFGEETNIDLPGEVKGRVPTPQWKEDYFTTPESKKWYLGDTYNLSIGQGYFLATPLQMAVGFSAIVNGGKLFEPRVVKEIVNPQTKERQPVTSRVRDLLAAPGGIDPRFIEIVKQGMRQTVSSPAGSAFRLSDLPQAVAAKTGTAQIYPAKEIYHNWIAVFAPYEKPEIVMVVLVESVEGLRIAAQQAAKEILDWYFRGAAQPPVSIFNDR